MPGPQSGSRRPAARPSRITSDPEVKVVFDGIAASMQATPVYTSGDRDRPVADGSRRSDHLAARAQDGHVQGHTDAQVFAHLKANPALIPPKGYQVIHHGPHTVTQGGHIHIGRAPDGHARCSRPSQFLVEGLTPQTRGIYTVVKVARRGYSAGFWPLT